MTSDLRPRLTNGCICCTLREDLLKEVAGLAREGRFDYLVIESTGIAEPLPVAETFTFTDEAGHSLSDLARLDTLVTVVDALNFLRDYGSADSLVDGRQARDEADDRCVVDLLVDQVEFADVVVVNKVDPVDLARRTQLTGILKALNPRARIVYAGFWWAAVEKNQWPDDDEECREIANLWQQPWGDRRQELVVIGQDLDHAALTARLNACLLSDQEMALGPETWLATFPDPFLEWRRMEPTVPEAAVPATA